MVTQQHPGYKLEYEKMLQDQFDGKTPWCVGNTMCFFKQELYLYLEKMVKRHLGDLQ